MKTKTVVGTFIAASGIVALVFMQFIDVPPSMTTYLHVSWVSWGLVGLFALAGMAVFLFLKTEGLLDTLFVRDAIAIQCFIMAGAIYLFFLS